MARKKKTDDKQKAEFTIEALPVRFDHYNQNDVQQEGGEYTWHVTLRLVTDADKEELASLIAAMQISKFPDLPDECHELPLAGAVYENHHVELLWADKAVEPRQALDFATAKIDGVKVTRVQKNKPYEVQFNVKAIPGVAAHIDAMDAYLAAKTGTEYEFTSHGSASTTGQSGLKLVGSEEKT